MTKHAAMKWCIDNLTSWPIDCAPDTTFKNWVWASIDFIFVNLTTGEYITEGEFYAARRVMQDRLTPCGMSFSELIEDLFL